MFRNKLEKWQSMDSFYGHCVGNNLLAVEGYMCSTASLVRIRMSCFFFCVGGCVSMCGCVKMCYHSSSQFQDQSLPTLSLAMWHNALSDIQIENTLYLKILRLCTVLWSGNEYHPRDCSFCILFFPSASVFGIEPEYGRRSRNCNISLHGERLCYNNSSKIPGDLSREIMKITVSTVK